VPEKERFYVFEYEAELIAAGAMCDVRFPRRNIEPATQLGFSDQCKSFLIKKYCIEKQQPATFRTPIDPRCVGGVPWIDMGRARGLVAGTDVSKPFDPQERRSE